MFPIKLCSILTTNPKSGASCSLRCLIYKVHAAWRSSDRLPLFKPFVKNFFQVFSNFFQSLSSAEFVFSCNPSLPARLVALASDLHIIAPTFQNVNTFFRVFTSFSFCTSFLAFSDTICGLLLCQPCFPRILLAEPPHLCYPFI